MARKLSAMIKIFMIVMAILGVISLLIGCYNLLKDFDNYTTYATNTRTATNADYKAQILCNFTSKEGFYCNQKIDVSVVVIHERPQMQNLTRIVFMDSKNYPISFFELSPNSGIYIPRGGHLHLQLWKTYYNTAYGTTMGIYKGKGSIVYDREGSYSAALEFDNETETVVYEHAQFNFTEPMIVVGTQADFHQIENGKTVLGLTWIVAGLTFWTIIIAVKESKR